MPKLHVMEHENTLVFLQNYNNTSDICNFLRKPPQLGKINIYVISLQFACSARMLQSINADLTSPNDA